MYHFIYPNKDSYIYELGTNSEKNFGGDSILSLKKDIDGYKTGSLNGVSRILLHFNLNEFSQSIVDGDIPKLDSAHPASASVYLRLYDKKTSELFPTYTLAALPLSQSWVEGSGYTNQNPNSRDGVSWERRNQNFLHDDTLWSVFSGSGAPASSGSRSKGGGVWVTGSNVAYASQSFSYESPDVNMDVTTMVSRWLGGESTLSATKPKILNNGLVLKWSGSQETSAEHSGDINFYSFEGSSIFSPKLEVKWDNHTACSGSNTGSLVSLGSFLKNDTYLYPINLKSEYKETDNPKIRIGGRREIFSKTTQTTYSQRKPNFAPEKSGSYSIIDLETNKTIIPFGEYSYLSCDETSNYFKLKLNSFINNRNYKLLLRLKYNDGGIKIFDNNNIFKVVK